MCYGLQHELIHKRKTLEVLQTHNSLHYINSIVCKIIQRIKIVLTILKC